MFYDSDGNPTLDTPEKAEAFTFLKSFIDDVNIPYNSNETHPFISGNAAMTLINNVALAPILADEQYEGKVGIAFPPYNTAKKTFCGCNMLFVGRDCKEKETAFDFIEDGAQQGGSDEAGGGSCHPGDSNLLCPGLYYARSYECRAR